MKRLGYTGEWLGDLNYDYIVQLSQDEWEAVYGLFHPEESVGQEQPQPAQQDGSVTIKMDGRSILQGDVFMDEQPAKPARRLVKLWIIGMFDSLDNVPISTVYTWTNSGAQILMFDNPYDTQADAEQALLEWEKDGEHADGEFVIMPVYRVEVTNGNA